MGIRVAINGFGRIGRSVLRALYESDRCGTIQVVAINDSAPINTSVVCFRNDVAGSELAIDVVADGLTINGDVIQYFSQVNPVKLPWNALEIDVVLECTGQFTQAEPAHMHILAGAKKVLISALSDDKVDATIVYGVNQSDLNAKHKVVSNGSCTLNCLAPMVKVLDDELGIESGLSTTLHAYDSAQDAMKKDTPLIPTQTVSPKSIGQVLPNLAGKIDGTSVRVSTLNVALLNLTFTTKETTTVEAVNAVMKKAAATSLANVLIYNDESSASTRFSHNAASCIFDATQTHVKQGHLVKVVAWFDNEWGFSNRMLDTLEAMMACETN